MVTLNLAVGVIVVALAVFSVAHLAAVMSVYRGAATRRPRNVSDERRQPAAQLARLLGELTLLGFRRFGEVELTLPDTSTLGPLLGRKASQTVWLLLDSTETALAEVVEPGVMLSLETWLSDDTVIQTTYPLGEDIDVAGLRASVVRSSPADAYEHHRRMVDARSAGAAPVGVHSMGEYLRHDASYRQRFARRFLRPALLRGPVLTNVLTLVLAAGLLAFWLLGGLQ